MERISPEYKFIVHNGMKIGIVNHLRYFLWHNGLNLFALFYYC